MSLFFPGANLSGQNLSGQNLTGVNLRGANLTGADLTDADLTDADLIDANLENAILMNANLTGVNLENANLRGVNLSDAILLQANLENTNFIRADLTGAKLTGANLTDADLTRASLEYANLTHANLRNINLTRASLFAAEIKDSNLTSAILQNADLTSINLTDVNLTDAILTDAILTNVVLTDADLTGANLTGADLTGANLTGVILENANLTRANLTRVDLTDVDLTGANLTGADLREANLIDTNLTEEQRNMIIDDGPELDDNELYPLGVAFEIHNAFYTFQRKKSKYLEIINQPNVNISIPIIDYINIEFTKNINKLFPDEKENKLEQLRTLINKLAGVRIEDPQLLLKSIQFIFSQDDDNLKREYITSFLYDSCNAYSGAAGDNTSCIKGIMERIVFSVGTAIQIVCIENCTNETYKKLDKLFNPKFDLEATASQWWEEEAIKSEIVNVTPEERKSKFISYLIAKAREEGSYNNEVDEKIKSYAETINYAFETLQLGGKKTKQKKKSHKRRVKKKTHKKRVEKKKSQKKKYKKSKTHRKYN